MSRSPSYQHIPGPDPYTNDHHEDDEALDLDLDFDLSELGPRPPLRHSEESAGRIPLRPLRFGGRRRAPPPPSQEEEAAEDLEALVGDDEQGGERGEEEGEGQGLLSGGGGGWGGRRVSFGGDFRNRRKRGLLGRLPDWMGGAGGRGAGIRLPAATTSEDAKPSPTASTTREVTTGIKQPVAYPPNTISNAKYTPWSFLPRTLWNEFKFFFNTYFLLVALSQIIPALRIGYLSTYVAPLAFVVSVTLGKEALDDLWRRKRDRESNGEVYTVLKFDERGSWGGGGKKKGGGKTKGKKQGRWEDREREEEDVEAAGPGSSEVTEVLKPSRELKVGDVVVLGKDQRVPADVILLKSFSAESAPAANTSAGSDTASDATLVDPLPSPTTSPPDLTTTDDPSGGGEAFIRTDQLDGETDWKLRLASPLSQTLQSSEYIRLTVTAGCPSRKVNDFAGTLSLAPRGRRIIYDARESDDGARERGGETKSVPLTIDNTAWANTVLASSTTVHAMVLYTGRETRAALSTSASRSKTGLLENEINSLTKILCFLTAFLSIILVLLKKVENPLDSSEQQQQRRKWYITFTRFLILFSTIVPISLRVNLDMGKSVYAYFIQRDPGIPGTVVRTSTIPEDLGRIEFLLSDKTGTLTRNEMVLRKIHVGTVAYGSEEGREEVGRYVGGAFEGLGGRLWTPGFGIGGLGGEGGQTRTRREIGTRVRDLVVALAVCHNVTPTFEDGEEGGEGKIGYQASSPDEIAIVRWTEAVGLRLIHRDRKTITLQSTWDNCTVIKVEILNIFPFTSESKRMGIVVRFFPSLHPGREAGGRDGDIVFYQKGADTIMTKIVAPSDWLDEETGNMAREGLRTLVVGRKNLTASQYVAFSAAYSEASLSLHSRDTTMSRVVQKHLEADLTLLGVTGVEDKLQANVKPSLELLRNAGIKIWMLTGDKPETARCVAVSSKLVSRRQHIHSLASLTSPSTALAALEPLQHSPETTALLVDGTSLTTLLTHHRETFIATAVKLPAVIACRCTPTQKADLALLIRAYTGKRLAAIGDGGNDVSMIQAADIGLGLEGKEGRQASLAADFSLTQFSHLTKLLLWHGRNSYKRSAKLAQFVMHRGLIISVAQTVFSVAGRFEPVALYRDWLLVGYATVYTMMPVFSLVLDRDVDEGLANLYPELYRELTEGRSLSYRTFFVWVAISLYQGLAIQGGAEILVPGYLSTKHHSASLDSLTDSTGFRRMVAVSYTSLIVNEILMVAIEITTWHPIMIFSILATAAIFFGSLPFLGGYFELSYLLEVGFWWRFVAVTAASVGPVWIGKVVRRKVKPAGWRKVRGL